MEEPQVPRIDNQFLDCSIYLYRTKEDAVRGERAGGSGFLVGVMATGTGWLARGECPHDQLHHTYAVSNRHVVRGHGDTRLNPGSSIIRLNTHSGESDVLPLRPEDWTISDEHDLAVFSIDLQHGSKHKYVTLASSAFVTNELMATYDIGIGDEVFMVGRFVNHDGKQRNLPSVRWGHVAMMPFEPVYHPSNPSNVQESFLVEVHSVSGYSGSPVFVRPFPTSKVVLEPSSKDRPSSIFCDPFRAGGPWLLGIEWGYLNNHDQRENNTGMSGVVPAWSLADLLNTEKLMAQRKQEQEEIIQRLEHGGTILT
jgi:hypothetical protein